MFGQALDVNNTATSSSYLSCPIVVNDAEMKHEQNLVIVRTELLLLSCRTINRRTEIPLPRAEVGASEYPERDLADPSVPSPCFRGRRGLFYLSMTLLEHRLVPKRRCTAVMY
jgi:hypothetical protein